MIVKALIDNGADKVYVMGRRKDVLQKARESLGPKVAVIVGDVSKKEDVVAAAAVVRDQVGYLNLLVCNAGILGPRVPAPSDSMSIEEFAASCLEIPTEEYTKTFEINTTAAWYTTMAFLTLLDAGNKKGNVSQSSQVITISSIAAFNKKAPGGWVYGQSKAALTHLTKQMSNFLPTWGIRANSILPGCKSTRDLDPRAVRRLTDLTVFPSEMAGAIVKEGDDGSLPKTLVPMGRLGTSDDMAGTLLYLASRAGSYCNGTHLIVDGGRLGLFPSSF